MDSEHVLLHFPSVCKLFATQFTFQLSVTSFTARLRLVPFLVVPFNVLLQSLFTGKLFAAVFTLEFSLRHLLVNNVFLDVLRLYLFKVNFEDVLLDFAFGGILVATKLTLRPLRFIHFTRLVLLTEAFWVHSTDMILH